MSFNLDENSFYEDLLKVVNKYIPLEGLSNENLNEINEKIYDIIQYIRQKFTAQKSNNYNNNKENLSYSKSNDLIYNTQKKTNISSNESIEKCQQRKIDDNSIYNNINISGRNIISEDLSNSTNNYNYRDVLKSKEEVNYESINKKPKGLYNLGLNCYMNSLLQCLYYIKELREYFIENKDIFNEEEQPVCKAFADVMYGLKNDENEYFTPKEFKKLIASKNILFDEWKAADVKDLFLNLIDLLLTELNEENDNDNQNEPDYSDLIQMFKYSKREIEYNDNIINRLFIGYYYTMYDCTQPEKITYTFQTESFILFELEKIQYYYPNKKNLTIDLLFSYYMRNQKNASFFCHYCKKTHIGDANEAIYRPPKILVIILDRGHGKTFKGNIEIENNLDLQPFITEENYESKYSTKYELIAVSSHRGESSSSGHYTASCLTDNQTYYYFSDINVIEINKENLINGEPYWLFYLRNDFSKDDNKKITNINNNIYNYNENIEGNEDKKLKDNIINKESNTNKLFQKNNIQTINSNNNISNPNELNNYSNIQKRENIQNINNENSIYKEINEKLIGNIESSNNKEYNEIIMALKKFLHNSNQQKFIIDYYDSNKNPCVWKLIIKSPVDSCYMGKNFEFKLDFSFGYQKMIENIKIEKNNSYSLNFIDNKGYLSITFKYIKNVTYYQNLYQLFNYIYNLFVDSNYYYKY